MEKFTVETINKLCKCGNLACEPYGDKCEDCWVDSSSISGGGFSRVIDNHEGRRPEVLEKMAQLKGS